MPRAFISHATEDRSFVEKELCGLLRAVGFEVWYAEESIQSTQQWERAILSGLEDSKWFILVMSPRSAESEWVKDEVNWAIDERPANIVPILIDDCDAKAFHIRLPRIQFLDFRTELKEARESLVALLVNQEYKLVNKSAPEAAYIGINAVIQASDFPMFFVDESLKIKFHNDQLATILCLTKSELDGKDGKTIVDRFKRLVPENTHEETRATRELYKEFGATDHSVIEHILDLRRMVGNRYHGMQRVSVSIDRIYFPGTNEPLGWFVVYRPTKFDG